MLMTKRLALTLAVVVCLVGTLSAAAPVSAKENWTSVRSKNFLLVGNATTREIREVAVRLEQFREVFSQLFGTLKVDSPVPTTVIVFKNDESYRPFKPNESTVGFFQPGAEVNYITLELSREVGSEQDPFTIIFHEYTHLLVRNTSGNVPTWFNEGLAEFYSTFSITNDQKVVVGRPIANHVYLLRQNKMLPLRTLFQVDHESPYYNERDKQSIFYAESWALLHYLILGNDGQRRAQLSKFIDLMSANISMEQAFQQAFAMTFETMEKELRAYIQRDRYPIVSSSFERQAASESDLQAAPITEAEVQAYLGDLLLKSNRAEAEIYLQKALVLNPDLALANASLGLLRVSQGRHEEARKRLERAVAASSQNYLIHYYYAYALSREGTTDLETVMGMAPETAAIMRRELKRAIELRPDFLESYGLLAFVNLVTGTELDETVAMLEKILAGSPQRNDLRFMLAQLYLRKEDFKTARQLIDKIVNTGDADLRQRAQRLLAQLVSVEAQLARIQQEQTSLRANGGKFGGNARQPDGQTSVEYNVDPAVILRDSLRKPASGETQTQGVLTRIDCDAKSITFVVRVGDRLLKLSTDTFQHAHMMSFSDDAGGQITCGARKPQNSVVVTYVATSDSRVRVDGALRSVEFVPADFKLKPPTTVDQKP
jgi:FimV-like protein